MSKSERSFLDYYLIYLRKSRQEDGEETIESVLQRHEWQLQEYAVKLLGYKIPDENIYREIVSGETIQDRPEINKVLKRIEDPHCKGVFTIEPQRLTRGDLIDCGTIISAFRYTNTLIYTPRQNFDLTQELDREFFERELLRGKDYVEYSKRIMMRGRHAAAQEGLWIASEPPYGYERVKLKKGWTLKINETEAEFVRLAYRLYAIDHLAAHAVASKLNELGAKPRKAQYFTGTSIRQMLSNETYLGKIRYGAKPIEKKFEDGKIVKKRVRMKDYQVYEGKHPAIIDEDTFNKAKEWRGLNSREAPSRELKNIYAGLLKCKKCGRAIGYRPYNNFERNARYYCKSGKYCDQISANVWEVNNDILNALKNYLEDFKVKVTGNNNQEVLNRQNIIKNLENELNKLDKRQEELFDFLESGIYTKEIFIQRNEKLKAEREEILNGLKKARQDLPSLEEYQQKYYSLYEAINAIENPMISVKQKNILLKNIIEVIWYDKNQKDKPHVQHDTHYTLEIVLK